MEPSPPHHPGEVLSALADPVRTRVFAALVLHGPASAADVAAATGVTRAEVTRALRRLAAGGLVGPCPIDVGAGDVGGPGQVASPGSEAPTVAAGGTVGGSVPGERWQATTGALAAAARLASRLAVTPDAGEGAASPEEAAILRAYLVNGRLRSIPAVRRKRLVVLDWLSQKFEPGTVYAEAEVNRTIDRYHPDHATLRRQLIDEDLMTRRDGMYWRSGGTFEIG